MVYVFKDQEKEDLRCKVQPYYSGYPEIIAIYIF